jgi:hypothetical protein
MAGRTHRVELLKLNKAATEELISGIRDVSISVMYQSKVLAATDKSDSVQSDHVVTALRMLTSKERTDWLKEFFKIIGGALFGAFIPGLITALNPLNVTFIIVFVASGFIGMLLVFIGLRK